MINRILTATATLTLVCCAIVVGCGPASTETTITTVEAPLSVAENQPPAETSTDSGHADFYTVSTYDEAFDPTDDLAKTILRAQAEHKRVILQVGGDWCGWCSRITDYMSTNKTVRSHLDKNFLVMKVTFPGERADEFLAAYPKCVAYPHLFVLDENGEFLHSQGTSELEKEKNYDDNVFMAFLTEWTP